MYLVDTNVLSHRAPGRVAPLEVLDWLQAHTDELYLSVVTLTEIEAGIAKAKRSSAARKARDLTQWLEAVVHLYGARILAIDTETARLAGRLADKARARGESPGLADILIAATAKHRGLTMLTRNVKHFSPYVTAIDPFARLPRS